jgi:hypothetical protein
MLWTARSRLSHFEYVFQVRPGGTLQNLVPLGETLVAQSQKDADEVVRVEVSEALYAPSLEQSHLPTDLFTSTSPAAVCRCCRARRSLMKTVA